MTCFTFLILLATSGYILDHGIENSHLFEHLQTSINTNIQNYYTDVASRRLVDIMQEKVCLFYLTLLHNFS